LCYAAKHESSQRAAPLAKMCSHGISLLVTPDVFCTKTFSHNHSGQIKNVFCKKISEIFDIFFFFSGFLARFDVFCKKSFVTFYPFPYLLGFLAKLGWVLQESKHCPLSSSLSLLAKFCLFCKII